MKKRRGAARWRGRAALAATGLWVLGAPGAARGQELTYSGSLYHATGRYVFMERTESWTLYSGLSLGTGRLRMTVSVPLLLQNTGAVSYVGGTLLPTGGPDHLLLERRQPGQSIPMGRGGGGSGPRRGSVAGRAAALAETTAAGDSVAGPGAYALHVADPFLSMGVEVYRGWGALHSIQLTGSAKAPVTTLASGFGTGAWDYSAGATVALGAGPVLLFGDVSYWHYGDLPHLELQDGISYGAGLGTRVSERVSFLASVSGSRRVIATVAQPLYLTVTAGYRRGQAAGMSGGLSLGLTEAASELSAFVGWRLGLIGGPH